jgi:hypothetical protein
MEHQEMTDERLTKAEQHLAIAFERSVTEQQEITDERLNKAEQLLAEANRRAEETTRQMKEIKDREEGIRVQAEIIAKRSNELNQEVNKQLLASIARAEKAERQSAEKMIEAEKRIQEAVESAALLEQKVMDTMKRIECSTGMRQRLNVVLADTHT